MIDRWVNLFLSVENIGVGDRVCHSSLQHRFDLLSLTGTTAWNGNVSPLSLSLRCMAKRMRNRRQSIGRQNRTFPCLYTTTVDNILTWSMPSIYLGWMHGLGDIGTFAVQLIPPAILDIRYPENFGWPHIASIEDVSNNGICPSVLLFCICVEIFLSDVTCCSCCFDPRFELCCVYVFLRSNRPARSGPTRIITRHYTILPLSHHSPDG